MYTNMSSLEEDGIRMSYILLSLDPSTGNKEMDSFYREIPVWLPAFSYDCQIIPFLCLWGGS